MRRSQFLRAPLIRSGYSSHECNRLFFANHPLLEDHEWCQTLYMRLKRGRKIGPVGSLLLLPFLLVAGVLSFPYAMLKAFSRKRNKQKLQARMEAQGRVIEWSEFLNALNETRGTAIIERYSFKGPVYLWWTPENLYDVCPYPTVDWMTLHDESYGPFAEWCRIRYTSRDAGSAVLVEDASPAEAHSLHRRFESYTGSERWIEVVPPEAVRKIE